MEGEWSVGQQGGGWGLHLTVAVVVASDGSVSQAWSYPQSSNCRILGKILAFL